MPTVNTVIAVNLHKQGENRETLPLELKMTYDPADPLVIAAEWTFKGASINRPWLFGRDVMIDGLSAEVDSPAGDGDFKAWSDLCNGEPVYFIGLDVAGWKATFSMDYDDIDYFLGDTLDEVPLGEEIQELTVDLLITQLFKAEGKDNV